MVQIKKASKNAQIRSPALRHARVLAHILAERKENPAVSTA
jgi:hypothetical protein